MKYWNYLLVLRPTRLEMLSEGPTELEVKTVGEHFAYCQKLVAEGRMLLAGRTHGSPETTIGIAILHAESDEEAKAMVAVDPAVLNGVMSAEVQLYQIALFYDNPHYNGE